MASFDEVCAKALALPCSPTMLPRLITLLQNPETNIDDLANLIQMDPVLASATVRMANSVYFSSSARVDTVAHAVMRLGARELYRLAALSMASRWMAIDVEGYRWEAGDFCRASLVKAIAAESLALRTKRVDASLAYTCGLVHDIGKLAIAFSCGEAFPAIRKRCTDTGCTWLEAETAELGFNYATVSARLLEEWRFPHSCVVVAKHNPPSLDIEADYRALAAHVHAADHLAAEFGAGQGEDAFLYTLDFKLLEDQGIDATTIEATLPTVLERASGMLMEKLKTGKIVF